MMTIDSIIKKAEYTDIILTLVQPPYCIESITKLVFIAFCINYESRILLYRNRTKDFVDTFFGNISLKLSAHFDDLKIIFDVLFMLERSSKITIENDSIFALTKDTHLCENEFLQFCKDKVPNPIIEINKLDSKALLEEVIRYV